VAKTNFFHRFRDEVGPGKRATDWSVRRAALVDGDRVLLSHTHLWLRRLPSNCQPTRLCRHYPRIANALAECWNDTTLGDRLLVDLLIDRRGSRAGFSVRIVKELHVLKKLRVHAVARDRIGDRLLRAVDRSIGRLTGSRASQF
jgi:hypothetical protein